MLNFQIRKAILRSLREKGCGQSVGEVAFGTWVARLIAAPLNQRATTSEWTALNDFEELEMKRYVILPFPHSSEALWGPR